MGIWIIQVFVILLVSMAICQDDEIEIMGERPMVLPANTLEKAEIAIEDAIFGNESDHMQFLGDWWPVPVGNSSVLNLTA